jgi:hypothetical protein
MAEAPATLRLENGVSVTGLAEFADFDFVEFGDIQGWILK